MKINLVSRDNGVGLSQDMALLEGILRPAGHDVQRVDWQAKNVRRCHVAIHLELINPQMLRHASNGNIGIFNLEWFQRGWRPHLPYFKQLWAKSLECYEVMRRWGMRSVHHTGFASRDLYDPAIPRQLSCLHLAGHSQTKNTDVVLHAWATNPDLPPLTVISHNPRDVPPGVRLLSRISDAELLRELNAAQIHLCPSRAEGWGHYITEGLSVGALVITTDGSPMNEHVRPEHGILVRPAAIGRTHCAADHRIDSGDLAAAVRQAMLLDPGTRGKMGLLGRQHLLARNARFAQTALNLLRRM